MRRHPLHWLARIGRPTYESEALRGDLAQQRRLLRRNGRSAVVAELWYSWQLLLCGLAGVGLFASSLLRPRVWSDVRYASRRWRRRPGFAAAATITLALGIAATTAIFSLVDHVLLRPLPWRDPDTLVVIHGVYPERRSRPATAATWNRGTVSLPVWDALRASAEFTDVSAYRSTTQPDYLLDDDRTRVHRRMDVSSNFLSLLGVPMALGRSFSDTEDNHPNDSILITYETWQARFAGRADIVGLTVSVGRAGMDSRQAKTIVGVVGPGFQYDGVRPEVFEPLGISAAVNRQYFSGGVRLIGRLTDATRLDAAGAAAATLATAAHPIEPVSARLVRLADEHLAASARSLWLLLGGAGLLLLVACANVAGLVLSDARGRRHELAVRATLGGTRGRLARQLMVEYLLLATIGTALGVFASYWLVGAVVAVAPPGLPRLDTVTVDLRVIVVGGAAGFGAFLLFGLIPAVRVARTKIAPVLAEGGRDGRSGRLLTQRALVAGELALAMILVTAAWLFGETVLRLDQQPLGFASERMAVITTTLTGSRIGDPASIRPPRVGPNSGPEAVALRREAIETALRNHANDRTRRTLEGLNAVPGVVSATATVGVPFVSRAYPITIGVSGDVERHEVFQQPVGPDYFATLDMPLVDGHLWPGDNTDVVPAPSQRRPVVVSSTFARRFFPEGAVGAHFTYHYGGQAQQTIDYEIVGVVGDVKQMAIVEETQPTFYINGRDGSLPTQFVVRTAGDPATLLPELRRAMATAVPDLVVLSTETMEDKVKRAMASERFRATLSFLFGVAALILCAVGVYGLASRRASDRLREFAVRVALGARPADVRRLVLTDAASLVLAGMTIGAPAAWWTAQLAASMLFGVDASSPRVFITASCLLVTIAVVATIVPALRAARVNPIDAIRN
ncbi:MAG: hypothetical protein AMXMBFR57_31130 [Acidimicrobiia bacterium]